MSDQPCLTPRQQAAVEVAQQTIDVLDQWLDCPQCPRRDTLRDLREHIETQRCLISGQIPNLWQYDLRRVADECLEMCAIAYSLVLSDGDKSMLRRALH